MRLSTKLIFACEAVTPSFQPYFGSKKCENFIFWPNNSLHLRRLRQNENCTGQSIRTKNILDWIILSYCMFNYIKTFTGIRRNIYRYVTTDFFLRIYFQKTSKVQNKLNFYKLRNTNRSKYFLIRCESNSHYEVNLEFAYR